MKINRIFLFSLVCFIKLCAEVPAKPFPEKPNANSSKDKKDEKAQEKNSSRKKTMYDKASYHAYMAYKEAHPSFGVFNEEKAEEFLQYIKTDGRLNPTVAASVRDKDNKTMGQELLFLKKFKKACLYDKKKMNKKEWSQTAFLLLNGFVAGLTGACGTGIVILLVALLNNNT